jgi:hypothetical protein
MSELLKEQMSAFVDDALPGEETSPAACDASKRTLRSPAPSPVTS